MLDLGPFPKNTVLYKILCILSVLSILTTIVYFFLSDHKNKITKLDRTFTKKRKEPDLVTVGVSFVPDSFFTNLQT